MSVEGSMHDAAQSPAPLAVNDPNLFKALHDTVIDVVRDELFHIARAKGVKVEHITYPRDLNVFV